MFKAINPPARSRLKPMGERRRTFKIADVKRAMKAVQAGGMPVVGVEISLDGSVIRLLSSDERPVAQDIFSQWENRL